MTVICSGLRPVAPATTNGTSCWNWVGVMIVAPSARTSATVFCGSIGECDRNGSS